MAQIILEVSEKSLIELTEKCKELGYTVQNPAKLLALLLQTEADYPVGYLDLITDGGGNALIGDVLDADVVEGVVTEDE